MKLKILSIVGIAAFAVVVASNINTGNNIDTQLNVTLANVEALARAELDEAACDRLCRYSDNYYCTIGNTSTGETKDCYYAYPR